MRVTKTSPETGALEDHSRDLGARPGVRVMTAGTTGLTLAGLKSLQSRGATRTHPSNRDINLFISAPSKAKLQNLLKRNPKRQLEDLW